MAADSIAPPPGFVLDAPATGAPSADPTAPPPGFELDQPGTGAPAASLGGTYRAGASAINRGIAGLAGFPVDAETWLLNKIPGVNVDRSSAWLGSEGIKRGMRAVGIDPDVKPQNAWERAAAAAGEAIPTTLGMLTGAGAATTLPKIGKAIAPYVEPLIPATKRGLGMLLGAAGVGGATGEVAQEAVPEKYQSTVGPLVNLLGNIAGGVGVAGAGAGMSALMREAAELSGRFLRPTGIGAKETVAPGLRATQGQQRVAGEVLQRSASNPSELPGKLDPDQLEIVPGSQPTAFQLSGDPGIGIAERGASTRNPAPFLERRAEQNRARVGAIEGQAPAEGQPGAVGDFFRRQLADIDAAGVSRETSARQAVDTAAEGMGGQAFATPQEYGQTIRGNLSDLNFAAKSRESALWNAIPKDLAVRGAPLATAARDIRAGIDPLGTPMTGTEERIFGNATGLQGNVPFASLRAMRSDVATAIRERIAQVRSSEDPVVRRLTQLRGAIDDTLSGSIDNVAAHEADLVQAGALAPENTIEARLRADQSNLYAGQDAAAGSLGATPGGGAGFVGRAGSRPAGTSSIPGDEGAAAGGPGSAPRAPGLAAKAPQNLAQFLAANGGVKNLGGDLRSIAGGFGGKLGAVLRNDGMDPDMARELAEEAGFLKPGSTLNNFYQALADHVAGKPTYRVRDAGRALDAFERDQLLRHIDEMGGGDASRWSDDQIARFLRGDPRPELDWAQQGADAGAEFDRLFNPKSVDQPALDAYAAARRATLERKQTFRAGPVGQTLAQGPNGAPFRLPESQVPAQFWRPGPRGSEGVQAYVKAGGDLPTLQDYAASDLRGYAVRQDGTMDLGRYKNWMKRFEPALSEQPQLRARFQSVADAQATLEETAAARKAASDALEQGAAKHFLGTDPDIAVGRAFGSANPDQTFADLVRLTGGDPAASQGLKRSVVDYILKHFRGHAEAGDTGVNLLKPEMYQNFIERQAAPLKRLFGADGYANLKAVADDIRRTGRSVTGSKLPGGSNTAQDTAALARSASGSVLSRIAAEASAAGAGTVLAGPPGGMAGWLGTKVLGAMRSAGMDTVNDLVEAALLDPNIARTLLLKVPATPQPYILDRLARQIVALSAGATLRAADNDVPEKRARGGAVRAAAHA